MVDTKIVPSKGEKFIVDFRTTRVELKYGKEDFFNKKYSDCIAETISKVIAITKNSNEDRRIVSNEKAIKQHN